MIRGRAIFCAMSDPMGYPLKSHEDAAVLLICQVHCRFVDAVNSENLKYELRARLHQVHLIGCHRNNVPRKVFCSRHFPLLSDCPYPGLRVKPNFELISCCSQMILTPPSQLFNATEVL
jgi:hypothetical protein